MAPYPTRLSSLSCSYLMDFFIDLTMKFVHVTVRKELYKDARVHQACWNAASVMFLYIFTSAVHVTEYKYHLSTVKTHFNPLKLI
jgi:hypothetical protein